MFEITPHLTRLVTSSDIPRDVLDVARLSLLDWLACGCAGASEPVSEIVRDTVVAEEGHGLAQLFGGGRAPVRGAALVNGAVSHALDYDDTHFDHIGHPSVAVFPAVMALAEAKRISVARMLNAALVGMEASIRVGVWLGRAHYQAGYHMTATAGCFGAAAGAARLLMLDDGRIAHALGLAATRASGLKSQFGTMGKPWNAGIAAASGVEAAMLVSKGFYSNPHALDGPNGFGALHHGEGVDPSENWRFAQVSHKFHACCHGLHAALEALRSLDLAAPEIASLNVRTHPRWMTVCNQQEPQTGLGAKFSYKTSLALALAGHDTARLSTFSDYLATQDRVCAVRDLISVQADDTLSEQQCVLEVTKRDGIQIRGFHDLDVVEKLETRKTRVRAKTRALIGSERADSLWRLISSDRTEIGDLVSRINE